MSVNGKWKGWLRLGVAVVILAVTVIFAWGLVRNPAAEVTEVKRLGGEGEVALGDVVRFGVRVRTPWYRIPSGRTELMLEHGVQEPAPPRRRPAGLGLGTWSWQVTVFCQPYTLGTVPCGRARIPVSWNRSGDEDALVVVLPSVQVTGGDAEEGATLRLAPYLGRDELDAGRSLRYWFATGAVIVAVLVVGFLLWRQKGDERRGPPPRPPWEIALREFQELEDRLPLAPDLFTVSMTDTLRTYIESRFGLRATEQTTAEFLAGVQREQRLVPEHVQLLGEVLSAADLIKFARADSTQAQLLEALAAARRFVVDTRPVPSETGAAAEEEGRA